MRLRHDSFAVLSKASSVMDVTFLVTNGDFGFWYLPNDEQAAERILADARKCASGPEEVAVFDLTGRMAAVGLTVEALEQASSVLGLKETVVACRNSPSGQTLSGSAIEMEQLRLCLEGSVEKLFWRDLNTDGIAYHAPHLSCYKEYLEKQFEKVLGEERGRPRELDPKWLSTSRGEVYSPEYHANNIVRPVFFQEAIERLPPNTVVVEIGGSSSMLAQVKRIRQDLVPLALVTAGEPETELASFAAESCERLVLKFWETGLPIFRDVAKVDRSVRLPLEMRCFDLWNHDKKQRIFDWSNFELIEQKAVADRLVGDEGDSGADKNETRISYDLKSKDAFLLDHRISGRALFPATGHLVTMWDALCSTFERERGPSAGVDFADVEILQAVVLDVDVSATVEFVVVRQDGMLSVIHDGSTVARAKFALIFSEALTKNELLHKSGKVDTQDVAILDHASVYNLFGRFGYEYRSNFSLLEQLDLTAKDTVVTGRLRQTTHLIAYLDSVLQLALKDVDGLALPTLIRQVCLHPECRREILQDSGNHAELDCATAVAKTEHVLLRNLVTTLAAPRVPQRLTHHQMTWLPINVSHACQGATNSSPSAPLESDCFPAALLVELVAQELSFLPPGSGTPRHVAVDQVAEGSEHMLAAFDALSGQVAARLGAREERVAHDDMFESDEDESPVHVLMAALPLDHGTKQPSSAAIFPVWKKAFWSDATTALGSRAKRLHETDSWVIVVSDVPQSNDISEHCEAACLDSTGRFRHVASYPVVVLPKADTDACRSGEQADVIVTLFRCVWCPGGLAYSRSPSMWKAADGPTSFIGAGVIGFLRSLRLEQDTSMLSGVHCEDSDPHPGIMAKHGFGAVLRLCACMSEDERRGSAESLRWGVYLNCEHTTQALAKPLGNTKVADADSNFSLTIERPGDLSSLCWVQAPNGAEYDTDVVFSALNFKDVMYSFGKIQLKKPSFGLEFSGYDRKDRTVRMMGIGVSSCIARRTKSALRWEVPASMTLEQAATVPVVYLTAAYALFEKARLEEGDSILVHAGTGGIGHAAIHLCQQRGIKVYATCAPHKRQYLVDYFGLDMDDVGSSRDTSFRELIFERTSGQGVTCVLNSLSGVLLDASLEVVADYGHFCEIGKYDLQSNTKIGLKVFERNVSYHAIELSYMFEHPRYSRKLQVMMAELLAKDEVVPLPTHVFAPEHVTDGLRFLSSGKHRGKVLIGSMRDFAAGVAAGTDLGGAAAWNSLAPQLSPQFHTRGRHIITGGLGGFGLELARWLVEKGADRVVLTSRFGSLRTGWQRFRFGALAPKVSVSKVPCDESLEDCAALLTLGKPASSDSIIAAPDSTTPLVGVWHVAGILQDALFANMDLQKWDAVNQIKATGVRNLDRVLRGPDYIGQDILFVGFSSVAALFGNAGQTNYAHANSVIDSVMNRRARDGLSGLSVQWGAIASVGMLAEKDSDARIPVGTLSDRSLCVQNLDDSLAALGRLLASPTTARGTVSCCRLEQNKLAIAGAVESAVMDVSVAVIQAKLAEILGGEAADYDDVNTPLRKFGLDSLSQIELVNWINANTKARVTPTFLTESLTTSGLLDYMKAHAAVAVAAAPKQPTNSESEEAEPDRDAEAHVEKLVKSDMRDVNSAITSATLGSSSTASSTSQMNSDMSTPEKLRLQDNLRAVDLSTAVSLSVGTKLRNQLRTVQIPAQLTLELFEQLHATLKEIDDTWASGVLVIEGASDEVFNHGAPIDDVGAKIPEVIARYVDLSRALFNCKNAVLVVRVRGSVRGGGLLFPAVADVCVAIAGDTETTFGLPEIHRQMVPGVVSAAVARKIGKAQCGYYGMTGRPFSVGRALELGLVHEVLDSDKAAADWNALVRRLQNSAEEAVFMKQSGMCGLDSAAEGSNCLEPEQMGTVMGEFFARRDSKESGIEPAGKQVIDCLELHEMVTEDGGPKIAVLTMCDETARNTFSSSMNAQLEMVVEKVLSQQQKSGDGYRALVLTSNVSDVFHCGANPHEMRRWCSDTSLSKVELAQRMKSLYAAFLKLYSLDIPVIAVLHGKVYGGGCPLALWADYRVGTWDLDLHYGNITRGMSPAAQLSELWGHYLPESRVLEFYYENAHWYGPKCLQESIVSSLHSTREQALEEALRLAAFVAAQAPAGVQRTRKQVKATLRTQIIDCEAWAIARSITEKAVFTNLKAQNESFCGLSTAVRQMAPVGSEMPTTRSPLVPDIESMASISSTEEEYGIVSIQLAVPARACRAEEVEGSFDDAPCASQYLQRAVGVWECDEDAISFAMTALQKLLDTLPTEFKIDDVGRLEVGTESNVDLAKSVKSYLTDLFPKSHRELFGVDNTNACYGGTAAVLNTLDWLRAHPEARFGIVVVTDTAVMNETEVSFQGAGAVALLLTRESVYQEVFRTRRHLPVAIERQAVPLMRNTQDFLKPRYAAQLSPYIRGTESMNHYLEALEHCARRTGERFGDTLTNVEYCLVHGGLCRSVATRVMNEWAKFSASTGERISRKALLQKFEPGLKHGEELGGLYAASLYFSLHSLLEHAGEDAWLSPKKVLLFSYGSGSTATMLRARVQGMTESFERLEPFLAMREFISGAELKQVIMRHSLTKSLLDSNLPEDIVQRQRALREKSQQDRYLLTRFPAGNEKRVYMRI